MPDQLHRPFIAIPISFALARFLVAGGLLSALLALAQYYEFRFLLAPVVAKWLGGGLYGNLAQPNHFASYTALALGSLFYLYGAGGLARGPAIGLAAPLFGVGFGQFPWHHFDLVSTGAVPALAGGPLFHQAHNLLLYPLAELGIAAPLLLVGLAGGWLLRSARAEPAHWGLLAMLGVLAIHSMLEFPLWYAFFLGVAAVLLGVGETRNLDVGLRRLAVPAGATMLVLGWWSAASFISSYRNLEVVTTQGLPAYSPTAPGSGASPAS